MIDTVRSVDDPQSLRQIYGAFPSGVIAICALVGNTPVGMAASSFTSVSLDPPLVSLCIQNSSTTWPRIRSACRLGLSVLAQEHDAVCAALSRKDGDRFTSVEWEASKNGAIFVRGSVAYLECSLDREIEAGDHNIALLAIHGAGASAVSKPLVFHGSRFRRLAPPL